MQESEPRDNRVRPEFAAVVFGLPAAIILLVTLIGPASLYEYLAGIAWAGSLLVLALRGFWDEERNAFAPVENRNANLVPVLLALFGVVALLESERVPGACLLILAGIWTFAAPSWRPLWKSKPVRFLGSIAHIVQALILLALLLTWLFSFFEK